MYGFLSPPGTLFEGVFEDTKQMELNRVTFCPFETSHALVCPSHAEDYDIAVTTGHRQRLSNLFCKCQS